MAITNDEQTKLDDLTKAALQEFRQIDHARTEELMNAAILVVALCQQKLQLRGLRSSMQPTGDVVVSTIFDADGKSSVPYAHIDRISRTITVVGSLAEPKTEDYDIPKGDQE